MMYGIVDVGSNTIRLTVYRIKEQTFKILFSQKAMTGLAGYVKDGKLSSDGIRQACDALKSFQGILKNFEITNMSAFATASLRNVENTKEALLEIEKETGLSVEVISGEEEAILDFEGATHNIEMEHGILVDIGGGSTEVVTYQKGKIETPLSLPMGSLNLYTKNVENILPKKAEVKKMRKSIQEQIKKLGEEIEPREIICGVGGSIRAASKLNNYLFSESAANREISIGHLDYILSTLEENNATTLNLILKVCPERIHTIIPGLLILKSIAKLYNSEKIIVSRYGVREGYLYERVVKKLRDA